MGRIKNAVIRVFLMLTFILFIFSLAPLQNTVAVKIAFVVMALASVASFTLIKNDNA